MTDEGYSERRALDLSGIERIEIAVDCDLQVARGAPGLQIHAPTPEDTAMIVCSRNGATLRIEGACAGFRTERVACVTQIAKGWARAGGVWYKGDGVSVQSDDGNRVVTVTGDNARVVMGDIIERSIVNGPAARIRLDLPVVPHISANGAGDIELVDVDQDALVVHVSGSGDLRASGRALQLVAHLSGSGDLKAKHLQVVDATLNLSGSGDASIHATRSVAGQLVGSGDAVIRGGPTVRDLRSTGSGDVRYRGDAA